jgi:hypothetical protein
VADQRGQSGVLWSCWRSSPRSVVAGLLLLIITSPRRID